jgi:hypothetical protein
MPVRVWSPDLWRKSHTNSDGQYPIWLYSGNPFFN